MSLPKELIKKVRIKVATAESRAEKKIQNELAEKFDSIATNWIACDTKSRMTDEISECE
jgi:hypothetical protein